MKKIPLIAVLLICVNTVLGQKETRNEILISDKFETFYNEGKADSIFALFSPEMKSALPLNRTIEFIKISKAQTGKITDKVFKRYQSSYALYRTTFEKSIFGLYLSVNDQAKIDGFLIKPYTEVMERNKTPLSLPFRTEWTVVWGGDTAEANYHVESQSQKNAFDFVITDANNKTYKTTGRTNEDYYAFGKELIAPCDGEVVLAVDGVKDNNPGDKNPVFLTGNTVIIKTPNMEYLVFAHFKQGSVRVRQGQKVMKGDLLGLSGNSGNSTEAHLHFHIQNVEEMPEAIGIKCYFDQLIVNGATQQNYSPVRNDKIKP